MRKKSKRPFKVKEPIDYGIPYEPEEEVEQPRPKYRVTLAYLIDQEEVNRLIEASNAEYKEPERDPPSLDYHTYTEDEVNALVEGNFHPRKSKKKK